MSHFHKPLIVTYMVNIWADYSPNQLLKFCIEVLHIMYQIKSVYGKRN